MNYNMGIIYSDNLGQGLIHDFFSHVIEYFKKGIEKEGFNCIFLNSNRMVRNRLTYFEQIQKLNIDGVLIVTSQNPADEIEINELCKNDIPIVAIDAEYEGAVTIASDNVVGMIELTNYAIDCGHKKIAFIHGDLTPVTQKRVSTFLETCAERGVAIPDEYLMNSLYTDIQLAAKNTEALLRLKDRPSCIFYSDDYAAIGGINILRARGYSIPSDMSIAGYDGVSIITSFDPHLTTIKQNVKDMGFKAAEKLIELCNNPDTDRSMIVVPASLLKGRSIGKKY